MTRKQTPRKSKLAANPVAQTTLKSSKKKMIMTLKALQPPRMHVPITPDNYRAMLWRLAKPTEMIIELASRYRIAEPNLIIERGKLDCSHYLGVHCAILDCEYRIWRAKPLDYRNRNQFGLFFAGKMKMAMKLDVVTTAANYAKRNYDRSTKD
jgi:hypothetical protein